MKSHLDIEAAAVTTVSSQIWPLCLIACFAGCSHGVRLSNNETYVPPEDVFYESAENGEGLLESVDELLTRYRYEKLDINAVARDELERLPEMDRNSVEEFLSYRSRRGGLTSISELDSVYGLSPMSRFLMKMILDVKDVPESVRINRKSLEIRFSADRSWNSDESPAYEGAHLYRKTLFYRKTRFYRKTVRISARVSGLQFSLTAQNEPYEIFIWDPGERWYGFDHIVSNVRWTSRQSGFEIIAGDFKVDVGQGLVHATPFGMRLSTGSPWRNLRSWSLITGYTGSTRQPTFRGAAVKVSPMKSVSLWVFASNVRTDARPVASGDSDSQRTGDVFTLVQSDLHVTEDQKAHRKALRNRTAGFVVEYGFPRGRFGFQYSWSLLSRLVLLSSEFSTPEQSFSRGSVFWSLTSRSWSTTAELSIRSAKPASVLGFVWRPIRLLRLIAAVRIFPERSFALYGKPYGYRRHPGAQHGLLIGMSLVASQAFTASTILDYSYESGSSETLFFPVRTSDYRLSAAVKATSRLFLTLSLRQKNAPARRVRTLNSGSGLFSIAQTRLTGVSLQFRFSADERWSVKARIDANTYSDGVLNVSRGFHLGVRASLQPIPGVRIVGQQSVYGVPSSENRFFIHESDIQGRLSVASLNNFGQRSSLLIRFDPTPGFALEFKYAGNVTQTPQEPTAPSRHIAPATSTAGRVAFQCTLAF